MTSGPCTPWITAGDLPCNTGGSPADDRLATAATLASDLLYAWSGRQFAGAGACRSHARPCPAGTCRCWPQLDWWYSGASAWDGWTWGGRSCGFAKQIRLPGYPVTAVESVTISGELVPAGAYELERRRILVRTDGLAWPSCQDTTAAGDAPGAFEIVYRHGAAPPAAGVEAAKALGCQLYAALTGSGKCQLPSGVTRVVRQGVTIERVQGAFSGARVTTGIPVVDMFLGAYNQGGHRRRPAVWSPDLPTARRV